MGKLYQSKEKKMNSWGGKNRIYAFNRDLSQELLQTHLTVNIFILSSQLHKDFLYLFCKSQCLGY